jgi:hypothetical protein
LYVFSLDALVVSKTNQYIATYLQEKRIQFTKEMVKVFLRNHKKVFELCWPES